MHDPGGKRGHPELSKRGASVLCLTAGSLLQHDRHAEGNGNGNSAVCASPDRSSRLQKDFRDPLLNAR